MASKRTKKEGTEEGTVDVGGESRGGRRRRGRREEGGEPEQGGGVAVAVAPASRQSGRVAVERDIGGRKLSIETGRFARQADGSCVVRYGDTMVLGTAQSAKAPEHMDFFPLTVDYREKTASVGVIPGGFFKREGRPTTKEILACRIIDRSIRPMFPDGFRKEVQVMSQVLAADRENDPDVIAAIASFAALALSSIPHGRTLGMCRIGLKDDKLLVNPVWSTLQSPESQLNLTVAAHPDAIVMVEAGAKQVSEERMLEALELGKRIAGEIAEMIDELVKKAGKPKSAFEPPVVNTVLRDQIESRFGAALRAAPVTPGTKAQRSAAMKAAKEQVKKGILAPAGCSTEEQKLHEKAVDEMCSEMVKQAERDSILHGKRADGRDHTTIRPITIDVGVLPRVHGSVLFTRGETQALGIVTLGGSDDQQIIDGLMPEPRKRFMLHYGFPPFSVGEVKRLGGPGRREIGHGALAERSLEVVLPTREQFPYTIRITSEILESNGSSSMASVCAGTLAMMDAGVKISKPVAGIAMGLVMEGKKYAILSDILGSEDGCGDMDFKVAGTQHGITALQMDIKCEGLTKEIMTQALDQARVGRKHILQKMLEVLRSPRSELSPNAPRLESLIVPSEKIGLIIGPAGRNIRKMQEDYECKISIEDGGLCTITGVNAEKVQACLDFIKTMTAEVELGAVYEGRVTAIKEFGAFVEVLPSQEGLVHVSELSDGFINSVTDAVRIGDVIKVKVIGIDDFGKIKLSRKAILLAEKGIEVPTPAPGEGGGRGPRGFGRDRDDRGPRRDRPERGDRPFEDRGPRMDRPDRGDRPFRGREDRPMREDRGPGDRPPRDERGFGDRPPREERPFGDRPPREERPFREEGGRPEGRGAREDRPFREEGGRPEGRGPREDRPFREEGGRPEGRGPREDRPFREEGGRPEGRGPREDRPFREEGGRPEGRGPREDRPFREERRPREDRPIREEGARAPHADRPGREERGERSEGRPAGDADRPERGGPRGREERGEGGDRGDRGGRGRDRGDRGPRRSEAPLQEFEPVEADLEPTPPPETPLIGDLEQADAVFGEDFAKGGPGEGSEGDGDRGRGRGPGRGRGGRRERGPRR